MVGTVNENPWILGGARLARQAALGLTDNPGFDFQKARQQWDSNSGKLVVKIPFLNDESPFGVSIIIVPTWYFFGAHQWQITQVVYGGLTFASTAPDRLYPTSLNIATVIQDRVVDASVLINPDGTLSNGQMMVISRSTRTIKNVFNVFGKITTQKQLQVLFRPQLNPQAVVAVPCVYPGQPNPNNWVICTPLSEKDYTVNPDGTPTPTPPIIENAPVNCNALAQQVNSLATTAREAQGVFGANVALGVTACLGLALLPPPFYVLAIAGCPAAGVLIEISRQQMIRANNAYDKAAREYAQKCT